MRRIGLTLFCLLIASFLLSSLSRASATLSVNEDAIRFLSEHGRTGVVLPIENRMGREARARIRLELVDPQNLVRASSEREEVIKEGASAPFLPLSLDLAGLKDAERSQLLWYRLRYRITPIIAGASTANAETVQGTVSLSQITSDIFDVRIAAPDAAREGMLYRARILTTHPLTGRAVEAVNVEAVLELETEKDEKVASLKAQGVTDREGYLTLDFNLPREQQTYSGELKVTARRGAFSQQATDDLTFDYLSRIFISTDKPLYQPGQTLHARALIFSPNMQAERDQKTTLKITDPEDTVVFRTELQTSRFGVASADWAIPENARLGEYTIAFGRPDDSFAFQRIKISRYDLPNFTVNVKPDRTFYLSGQSAEVEVRADYLFGQPVKRARVRVVREREREWNYREQKWETKEGKEYKGSLDAEGRFVARINLSEEHESFKDDNWRRFEDLTYAAYLTDLSTGRTEQRRFDLRLTKEAIHVYVVGARHGQSTRMPLEFYLSTFYADGSPAQCEVVISAGSRDDEDAGKRRPRKEGLRLAQVRTNRFGLAKVTRLKPAVNQQGDNQQVYLRFKARDARGTLGHESESFYFEDRPDIHVATNKTLYRTNDPLQIEITSSEAALSVMVDVMRGWQVVRSELVRLKDGRAVLTLPYDGEFRDQLLVAAHALTGAHDYVGDSQAVMYPRDRELKLDVQPLQSTYRPGEEARVQFSVRTPEGLPIESALGVVVLDRAVEERARTDREFGARLSYYGNYYNLLGYGDSLAGISRKDLEQLDLSKPIPADLELLAEMLLNKDGYYRHDISGGDRFETSQPKVFAALTTAQLRPVKDALHERYSRKSEYPHDESDLRRILSQTGIDFDKLPDPWGTPYRAAFSFEKDRYVLTVMSAGADKRTGTMDDFSVEKWYWPYFQPVGDAINRAVNEYHARTSAYVRDAATLKTELLRQGVAFDALRDPWGSPYKIGFDVKGPNYAIRIKSAGVNRRFDGLLTRDTDDFIIWNNYINYFAQWSAQINEALYAHLKKTRSIPQNMKELRAALQAAKMNFDAMLDPWGKPYYATFRTESAYADRLTLQNVYSQRVGRPRTEITPVTQKRGFVTIRSAGADGKEGTPDDFDTEVFSLIISEQSRRDAKPQTVSSPVIRSGRGGTITGTVLDVNGAVIANATVKATGASNLQAYETLTNDEGIFIFRNLPAGTYEVRIVAPGFVETVVTEVQVSKSSGPVLNITLQAAGMMETVNVEGSDVQVETSSTTIAQSEIVSLPLNGRDATNIAALRPGAASAQASTPRLREYFPETLLWQPSLETDAQGRASLNFKLADNITTWKLAVIGSTSTGEIGMAEKEIRSFQPFFVEHDPPRILTQGDEIALPVVLRNYLDKSQQVELEMKAEDWFQLLSPGHRRAVVPAGDNARQVFDFRAVMSVKEGKQRITATGAEEAQDAIEKPVHVHPDGEERAQTTSGIFRAALTLDADVPADALKGTPRAELKIYPNLLAHVAESVESIMQRPYGCGEQTISSAYPSLLTLQYYKRTGLDAPITGKARRYVQAGYERLLNYRATGGGFSYWGRGEADIALTAYALKFLYEAGEFMAVDVDVVREAREWLIKQQRADGSWPQARISPETNEDKRRTALLTAYIARVLAMLDKRSGPTQSFHNEQRGNTQTISVTLKRALGYLTERFQEVDEPYLIASTALAAHDAQEKNLARLAVSKLLNLAKEENGSVYWSLETNTPFYGWGLAGRIETTALALQAIQKYCGRQNADCGFDKASISSNPQSAIRIPQLLDGGLLFLLRGKDRYGVWYSTQATINVLDTLVMLLAKDAESASLAGEPAEVFVNGQPVKTIEMPKGGQLSSPLTLDLSPFISHGANKIELRRADGNAHSSAQVVTTYYVPWTAKREANHSATMNASSLRLSVNYDKPAAAIGEEISCRVEVERVGFSGYGMLLGEIGLPPGADVDRASLELAMKETGWSLSRYDILPDRLIVYLWPRGGGTRFSFKFRTRFGLTAQTAPSLLYDYYNPEARTVLAPTKFVVK